MREYQSRFGLNIYAISLANEPCISVNYSSCCWTGAQFRDFIKNNLRATFQADGVTAKVMIGEREAWDESVASESLADPVAVTRVDLVGGHAYSGAIVPFSNALNHGKQVWQTEVSYFTPNDASITDGIRWAKMVHDFMTVDTSAFLYWWLVTEKTNGEGLVNINRSNNTYTLNKRLFTLGNYARFVRPEYVRIDATANPAANIFTTAYRDPASNQFVVVVINDNATTQTLDLTPSGFSARQRDALRHGQHPQSGAVGERSPRGREPGGQECHHVCGHRDGRWFHQHAERDCHARRPDQYATGDTHQN